MMLLDVIITIILLEQLLNDYYRELETIIGKDHIKKEHDTITILRDEVDVE